MASYVYASVGTVVGMQVDYLARDDELDKETYKIKLDNYQGAAIHAYVSWNTLHWWLISLNAAIK